MMLEQKGILEQGENVRVGIKVPWFRGRNQHPSDVALSFFVKQQPQIFDEKAPKLIPFTPHKEIVRKIDYINKERKYITVGWVSGHYQEPFLTSLFLSTGKKSY
jgi:hypothetical protein